MPALQRQEQTATRFSPKPVSLATSRPGDQASAYLASLTDSVKPLLVQAGLLSALASGLWLIQAMLIGSAIGGLVDPSSSMIKPVVAATGFLIIGLSRGALQWAGNNRTFLAADRVMDRERKSLLSMQVRVSPLTGGNPNSGQIAALIGEKVSALQPYLVNFWPARFQAAIVPVGIALVVLPISWVVLIILMVAGPLIPVFMALIGLAARQASQDQLSEIGNLNTLLVERLTGLFDIRLLDASRAMLREFASTADDLRERTMRVLRIAFLSSTVLELFSAIGVAMVAVYVGFSLLGNLRFGTYGQPLSVTEGIVLLMLAPEFFRPLRDLAAAWHDKAAATAVASELHTQKSNHPETIVGKGAVSARFSAPVAIRTRALSYRTATGRMLHFPDIDIRAGSATAITGPSGAGKSTLLALLAGLARPYAGEIQVCGQRLDDTTADQWRAHLAWISQQPHFVSGTVAANIALGASAPDQQRLDLAISDAAADAVVRRLPGGLSAKLGETGAGISGGEARRLILARALYARPDVLFADEPTADLDARTARQVTATLLAMSRNGCTMVVASHDPDLIDSLGKQIALGATR